MPGMDWVIRLLRNNKRGTKGTVFTSLHQPESPSVVICAPPRAAGSLRVGRAWP